MDASHSKTVAEMETRLLEEQLKHEAELADRDREIKSIEQSSEDRLKDAETLAWNEQQSLLNRIRFGFGKCFYQILLPVVS